MTTAKNYDESRHHELLLYGTHGTLRANVDRIRNEGFSAGIGRVGKGVYFWEKSEFSDILALEWCKFSGKRIIEYSGIDECSIIRVRIMVGEDHYLDFEDNRVRALLAKIVKDKKISDDKDSISALFDMFISSIERDFGMEIFVWRKSVAPPRTKKYPLKILGAPVCYITSKPDLVEIESVG
ncbi:MAG: hypothetical protein J7L71_04910 [Spirochaetaceae bacterium]|nr:hypothetical protein [Spirochaetaceae bacterium]